VIVVVTPTHVCQRLQSHQRPNDDDDDDNNNKF
jgi:hypothetical protein